MTFFFQVHRYNVANWRRIHTTLSDTTEENLVVKLWNAETGKLDEALVAVNDKITVDSVIVDSYKGMTYVNSTSITSVDVSALNMVTSEWQD